MVAMDFFVASNSYDFFNQYCSNLLKNPTVRGLIDLFRILVRSVKSDLVNLFSFEQMLPDKSELIHSES